MNFQFGDSHSRPVFKSNHILKIEDKILIENIHFIKKSFNNLLPPIFKSWFTFCSDVHNYQAVLSTTDRSDLILTLTRNVDTSVVWHRAVPLILA